MKKMILFVCLILFLGPAVWGQEKIETPPEYKIGDRWEWKWTRGREGHSWSNRVIDVKENEIVAVTKAGNTLILDKQYNVLQGINKKGEDITHNFWWERWFWFKEFPLHPGKIWNQTQKGGFTDARKGIRFEQDYEIKYHVEGVEEVKVPAGNFIALKIMFISTTEDETGRGKIRPKATLWYSPEAKHYVKGVWGEDYWLPFSQRGAIFQLIKFEQGK